jgi:hypothetical protein
MSLTVKDLIDNMESANGDQVKMVMEMPDGSQKLLIITKCPNRIKDYLAVSERYDSEQEEIGFTVTNPKAGKE